MKRNRNRKGSIHKEESQKHRKTNLSFKEPISFEGAPVCHRDF